MSQEPYNPVLQTKKRKLGGAESLVVQPHGWQEGQRLPQKPSSSSYPPCGPSPLSGTGEQRRPARPPRAVARPQCGPDERQTPGRRSPAPPPAGTAPASGLPGPSRGSSSCAVTGLSTGLRTLSSPPPSPGPHPGPQPRGLAARPAPAPQRPPAPSLQRPPLFLLHPAAAGDRPLQGPLRCRAFLSRWEE